MESRPAKTPSQSSRGEWHKLGFLRSAILRRLLLAAFCLDAVVTDPALADSWQDKFRRELRNGGAYVESAAGEVLFSHRADEPFVPASTLKVATAACALKILGPDYRFRTEVYLLDSHTLGIKGFGDPNLVSEELVKIAATVRSKLPAGVRISRIVVDGSFFASDVNLDGYANSDNPYDALPTALAANFNTLFLERLKNGTVRSGEAQTPLTPISAAIGGKIPKGAKQRINLGKKEGQSEQYFGELFASFLLAGTKPEVMVEQRALSSELTPLYRHLSSRPLESLLPAMLEFSTNFTANELFLVMGAERFSPPANAEKGSRALRDCLKKEFGVEDFQIFDGAGLSHRNRISPREFGKLLRGFADRRSLLRTDGGKFQAKTGSLKRVNTYAGYFTLPPYGEVRFGIFVNDDVPFPHKWKLAELLYLGLGSEPPDIPKFGEKTRAKISPR